MPSLVGILIGLLLWTALIACWWLVVVPWLRAGPRGDATTGLMWRFLRLVGRLIHRVQYEGLEGFRDSQPQPLIVVSNHTGSVDPLLIQAGCRFHIRWLMADNQMSSTLDWLWKREAMIPVARSGEDMTALREGIRHVKSGRAIGIFPEGRLVYPRGRVWPFFEGVGLLVRRTRAPIMLVCVTGTPQTLDMGGSLITPSRARVRYIDLIEYDRTMSAAEITADLRRRISEVSGWPMVDETPPMDLGTPDPFGMPPPSKDVARAEPGRMAGG